MSEYQYYEFLAIDRPLTDHQMSELRSISSRAKISPAHFSNEYNYGDLKADPFALLERYFDVHVYVTNWGSRRLGLRLPADLVEIDPLKRYCVGQETSMKKRGDFVLLDVWSETEDHEDWEEGADWMASVAPVREEILRGDLRALYLAWLLAVQSEELSADDTEPPVPPGLASLSAPLDSLGQFLRLDHHLMTAAAEGSAARQAESKGLGEWIDSLPRDQKNAALLNIVQGNHQHVGIKLLHRFRSETSRHAKADVQPARTVGALRDRAEVLRDAHQAELTQRAEKKRRRLEKAAAAVRAKQLDALAKRQSAAWRTIEKLVASKKRTAYDEAVLLLEDLRELSNRDNQTEAFAKRLASLRDRHSRKSSFLARLKKAGLPQPMPATPGVGR